MSKYFEFTTGVESSGGDFVFVTKFFEFDSGIAPPESVYFTFDTSVTPPPAVLGGIILSFRDPQALNPFNVKKVTGLDADSIISKYYGSAFNALSLKDREVVITVGLNPNFSELVSYSDLRNILYRLIAATKTGMVQIYFKNGTETVAVLKGHISKLEADHFARIQEAQITINCPDPMLRAPERTEVVVDALDPASTTINDILSTAPHGFCFHLEVTSPFADLTITNDGDDSWEFKVIPSGGFLTGDVLYFCSEERDRQLYITRGSTTIQLLDLITASAIWPLMFPGSNVFSLTNPTNVVWNDISYYPTYWGV